MIVGVHEVTIDDGGSVCFLYRFLGNLDAVVDDEEGIVCSQDLVVKGNAIKVLLQEGFQHLVVLAQSFLLLLDSQSVQQHLVVSLEEVVQVSELFVLFGGQFLKLVLHFFGYFALIDGALVEGQNFLLLSFKPSGQLGRFENSFTKFEVFLQLFNGVSGVISELLQPSIFFISESVHFFFQLLIILGNIVLFLFQSVVPCTTFLLVLKDLQLEQVNFGAFSRYIASQFINFKGHIFIVFEVFAVLLCFLACIRRILLMHLFQLSVMLSLFGFQIEFHMLKFLQILIFDLLPKGLLLSPGFLSLPPVLLLDSFNHIVEFLEVIVVGLFHFLAFGEIFLLENIDISSVLLHESMDARGLDGEEAVDVNEVVAEGDLVLVVGLVEVLVQHLDESFLGVEFSLVVLGVDVDFVAQFFCLCDTHDLPPVGQQLLLVEVHDFVLAFDFGAQNILFHLRQLLQLVELLLCLGDLSDLDVLFGRQSSRAGAAALQGFAQQSHRYQKTIMKLAALPIQLITPSPSPLKWGISNMGAVRDMVISFQTTLEVLFWLIWITTRIQLY